MYKPEATFIKHWKLLHISRSLNGEFTKALQETVVISNLGGCPTQFILAQRLHECAPKWSKNGPKWPTIANAF